MNSDIQFVESEALTLHGLMMSSNPYYLLLKPNSVEIIRRVWDYRREYKYPVCFSLDAGSNIHLLYPSRYKKVIKEFITNSKVLKTGKEVTEQVVRKAGPKISSAAIGELTVLGGIATDLSMAAYRLQKGDNTGALLSTLAAIPVLGIPFNVVDVARDLGAFEDGGILDKIDFLNLFRLNKDNPNYVDKRTAEEKEIDEDIDAYLKEEYEKDLLNQLENLPEKNSGNRKAVNAKSRTLQNALRELRDGTLTSDKLRSKVGKEFTDGDIKFFGKNKSSYDCLLYTSPSPRDVEESRMPSSA